MVKLINRLTGTEMWVAEERAEEYKAAGHEPAASAAETTKPAPKKATKSARTTKK